MSYDMDPALRSASEEVLGGVRAGTVVRVSNNRTRTFPGDVADAPALLQVPSAPFALLALAPFAVLLVIVFRDLHCARDSRLIHCFVCLSGYLSVCLCTSVFCFFAFLRWQWMQDNEWETCFELTREVCAFAMCGHVWR